MKMAIYSRISFSFSRLFEKPRYVAQWRSILIMNLIYCAGFALFVALGMLEHSLTRP